MMCSRDEVEVPPVVDELVLLTNSVHNNVFENEKSTIRYRITTQERWFQSVRLTEIYRSNKLGELELCAQWKNSCHKSDLIRFVNSDSTQGITEFIPMSSFLPKTCGWPYKPNLYVVKLKLLFTVLRLNGHCLPAIGVLMVQMESSICGNAGFGVLRFAFTICSVRLRTFNAFSSSSTF